MEYQQRMAIGAWRSDNIAPAFSASALVSVIPNIRETLYVVAQGTRGRLGVGIKGQILLNQQNINNSDYLLLGILPPLFPEWLGDRSFLEAHKLRFPYIAGAMFNEIASAAMVVEMAKAGMIGFFGSAGLPLEKIEQEINQIEHTLLDPGLSWGSNLIYSPSDPCLESAIVDLYLRRGVKRVSAAAFMQLSPHIVRYAITGVHADSSGRIHRKNYVFAKVSRPETARIFMEPAPTNILNHLVSKGQLTKTEADLARGIPIAEDITVEADSGGHTDNRPLTALLPTIISLRNEIISRHGYKNPIRIGAAGGLGNPLAISAAFALGAAYVLTGSVNQSSVESGMSKEGKKMLATAGVADMAMAPSADMFELGAKVQVLKRGTMFSNRASYLKDLYTNYNSLEEIPVNIKSKIEKEIFQSSLEDIWSETQRFFMEKNPKEIENAHNNTKQKMALVFRWYLGNASRWAIEGNLKRRVDYQICCGPSMGAFNAWVKGSFLERIENRKVADIALNLLEGAAVNTRAQQLRTYGLAVPASSFDFRPRFLS